LSSLSTIEFFRNLPRGGHAMGLYLLGGLVALGLLAYLLVAMLKPELFS